MKCGGSAIFDDFTTLKELNNNFLFVQLFQSWGIVYNLLNPRIAYGAIDV